MPRVAQSFRTSRRQNCCARRSRSKRMKLRRLAVRRRTRTTPLLFAAVIAVAVLLATALHGMEAVAWAGAYRLLGAVPDNRSAMLYSLHAITTYGHESVLPEQHWQMMGALEALNGMLLFGLTTAFLFAMIQEVWQVHRRR